MGLSEGMKHLLLCALLGILGLMVGGVAVAAEMRASSAAVRKEVIAAVEAQLGSFRKGDVAGAFGMASTALRAQRSAAVFAAMVESGYPEIWANTRAEFGVVRSDGTKAEVVVQVYSKTGSAGYDYALVKEPNGWRVHGVLRHASKKEKA